MVKLQKQNIYVTVPDGFDLWEDEDFLFLTKGLDVIASISTRCTRETIEDFIVTCAYAASLPH